MDFDFDFFSRHFNYDHKVTFRLNSRHFNFSDLFSPSNVAVTLFRNGEAVVKCETNRAAAEMTHMSK